MQVPDHISDRMETLKKKFALISVYVHPEEKEERLAELRDMTLAEGFWNDQENAQAVNREISELEFENERWTKVRQIV